MKSMSVYNRSNVSRKNNCHAFMLIELLIVIGVVALLLSILLPSLRRVKQDAKKVECTSNLHQIALAVQLYAENNDGRLIIAGLVSPVQKLDTSLSIWHNALLPYVAKTLDRTPQSLLENTTGVWFCPADKDPYPLGYRNYPHGKPLTSYAPNGYYPLEILPGIEPPDIKLGSAGGYLLTEIASPQSCMLMGETSYASQFYDADAVSVAGYNLLRDGHYRSTSGFYHNNSMNVLFVDGHSETIKGQNDGQLIWPSGFESQYKSSQYMYWPDLTLPSAAENPAFWGPGY